MEKSKEKTIVNPPLARIFASQATGARKISVLLLRVLPLHVLEMALLLRPQNIDPHNFPTRQALLFFAVGVTAA